MFLYYKMEGMHEAGDSPFVQANGLTYIVMNSPLHIQRVIFISTDIFIISLIRF